MYYYLATIIGLGTKEDPFRPAGTDGAKGWGMLDLRADSSQAGGYCVLGSIQELNDPKLQLLGQDGTESFTGDNRALAENKLSITVGGASTFSQWIEQVICNDYSKWKPVLSDPSGAKRVFIAGEKIVDTSAK